MIIHKFTLDYQVLKTAMIGFVMYRFILIISNIKKHQVSILLLLQKALLPEYDRRMHPDDSC